MPCRIGSRRSAARFAISSTLISLFTVLFTGRIPQPLFDFIVMTYRCEWRALSYAFFMHKDYPPSISRCPARTTALSRTRRCA